MNLRAIANKAASIIDIYPAPVSREEVLRDRPAKYLSDEEAAYSDWQEVGKLLYDSMQSESKDKKLNG